MPPGDFDKLAEQKRAAAEEMRRIAKTLWLGADRARILKRAAELEAESRWLVLDAAVAVAARVAKASTRQAKRSGEKDKS
jgi:hypothetical protein